MKRKIVLILILGIFMLLLISLNSSSNATTYLAYDMVFTPELGMTPVKTVEKGDMITDSSEGKFWISTDGITSMKVKKNENIEVGKNIGENYFWDEDIEKWFVKSCRLQDNGDWWINFEPYANKHYNVATGSKLMNGDVLGNFQEINDNSNLDNDAWVQIDIDISSVYPEATAGGVLYRAGNPIQIGINKFPNDIWLEEFDGYKIKNIQKNVQTGGKTIALLFTIEPLLKINFPTDNSVCVLNEMGETEYAVAGEEIKLLPCPLKEGQKLKTIKVVGESVEVELTEVEIEEEIPMYKFTMPKSDVTITVEFENKQYTLLSENNSKCNPFENNTNTLTFKANGDYSLFTGIKIDNEVVDTKNYTSKEGSTIITLKNEYLKVLSSGSHKLEILYSNDTEVIANFEIVKDDKVENEKDETPKTGKESYFNEIISLVMITLLVGIVLSKI